MGDGKNKNGGNPVIVNIQKRDLGVVAMGSSQSNTNFSATSYGPNIYGNANTQSREALHNFPHS